MIKQKGFTLIEVLVFIIVVSIGLTGIVTLYTTNIKNSAAPLIRERTLIIAHAYMDEIISKQWDENSPLGGGCVDTDGDPAITTDSCTQYCSAFTDTQCERSKCTLTSPGNCEAPALISSALGPEEGTTNRPLWDDIDDYAGYSSSPPQTLDGSSLPSYTGYTASVSVTQPASSWQGIPAVDVRRISVTVSNPLGESLTLVSYRTNF